MSLRRVVVIGKEAEVQQLAQQVGQEIFVADDLAEALNIVEAVKPDLILFDHWFNPVHIRDFLDSNQRQVKNSDVHIIVVGNDENNIHSPAEFIQAGAHDYLQGKRDYPRLKEIVDHIKNSFRTSTPEKNENDFFADELSSSLSMVGHSEAMLNTLRTIRLVAASSCNPVLIVGETGTGKELAARAVHNLRAQEEPFVAVNCAALTANLLESELFGHKKGSFTGADREKIGLLELAGSGTIFLDEISEMPTNLQAKLLRVLQEKTFRMVGGIKNIACNATIITSSNRNLKKEVHANRFRPDLYYRLNICPITIAPLRSPKRRKDIPLLVKYFLRTSTICSEKINKISTLTKLAIEALQKHDWPGNVRELRNVIERAILLETTDKIGLSTIIIDTDDHDELSVSSSANRIKDFSLEKAERELIVRALQETDWQKTRAATLLGITRATLYAKLKHYNIEKGLYIAKEQQDEISALSSPEPIAVA